ncbi:DUF1304 domain-containing protein [Brachybacterium huguangmaarense]
MLIAGLVLAALAAALHVSIFWMESLAWEGPAARRTFGPATDAEVEATRPLALNQGFYNLFLAVIAGLGIVLAALGHSAVGATLVLVGTGAMLAAALVLFVAMPDKRRAAITQGTLPLLAVVATALALAL